ncbi:MAG: YaiO family outer membrane beta-barrel protein [Gammaproteobacteria bacterium]|nr:YaiO family outer membrane beta-barrel protein [Gammaproteobacteria bacterium]
MKFRIQIRRQRIAIVLPAILLAGLLADGLVAYAMDDVLAAAHAELDAGHRDAALAILEQHVADQPGDQEARYLYARVLAWEQQWKASLVQYDQLLTLGPDNADYLLGKSQVLVWSGRAADALPLLEKARQLAPDYEAIMRLEAQALRVTEAPTQSSLYANHIEGGFSVQKLSKDLPDWTSLFVQAGRRLGPGKSVFGQLRQIERFDEKDGEIAGGIYWPAGDAWNVSADASLAPGAIVLPEWSLATQIHRPFERGFGVQVGLRHSEYAANYVRMLTLTGDYYWKNYYAGWTVYLAKLEGADPTFSNQWRIDRYYGSENRMGFLLAIGEEVESVGNGNFISGDTFLAAFNGIHWVSPVWGISWDLIFHEQGDFYRRGGFRVGLRRQF